MLLAGWNGPTRSTEYQADRIDADCPPDQHNPDRDYQRGPAKTIKGDFTPISKKISELAIKAANSQNANTNSRPRDDSNFSSGSPRTPTHCQVNGIWVAFGVPLCRAGGNRLGRLRTNPWPRRATPTPPP